MDSSRYADPNCKLCEGRGRVKTGARLADMSLCICAVRGTRREAAELKLAANFPKRARSMTFESYDTGGLMQNEMALQVAQNFCENFETACEKGWTLMFWGKPASGKTHLGMAIAHECVMRYLADTHFVNVPALLKAERERFSSIEAGKSEISKAAEAELLVLDDYGAQYDRLADNTGRVSWVQEQIYEILDERFMNNRPTIITSNLSPSDIERQLGESGERIWSRIERSIVGQPIEVARVDGVNKQDDADAALLFANVKK